MPKFNKPILNFHKKKSPRFFLLFFFLFFLLGKSALAQPPSEASEKLPFLQPADTLHKGRFWTSVAIGGTSYTLAVIGLSQIWYADVEKSSFQLFNDFGEWRHVDKIGHTATTYNYCRLGFDGANWTGMNRRNAMWTVAGVSFLMQGTIEVMDGFSAKWGFSIPDIAFNTLGAGLFVGQELAWGEQRITMKTSSTVPTYPEDIITSVDGLHTTTLRQRAHKLYGTRFPETFIKDYNAQTNWLSFNVRSFMKNENSRFPKWLNVAVGYGAQNMYEGFDYEWTEDDTGIEYRRDPNQLQRYSQMYLSFDVDLTRIPTKNRFLKTAFSILNFIKIPAPTLEMNTLGKVRFIPIYW